MVRHNTISTSAILLCTRIDNFDADYSYWVDSFSGIIHPAVLFILGVMFLVRYGREGLESCISFEVRSPQRKIMVSKTISFLESKCVLSLIVVFFFER